MCEDHRSNVRRPSIKCAKTKSEKNSKKISIFFLKKFEIFCKKIQKICWKNEIEPRFFYFSNVFDHHAAPHSLHPLRKWPILGVSMQISKRICWMSDFFSKKPWKIRPNSDAKIDRFLTYFLWYSMNDIMNRSKDLQRRSKDVAKT